VNSQELLKNYGKYLATQLSPIDQSFISCASGAEMALRQSSVVTVTALGSDSFHTASVAWRQFRQQWQLRQRGSKKEK
jgi:hypothetical protein